MSAIFGAFNADLSSPEDTLQAMAGALAQFGPDGLTTHVGQTASLGHQLLHIPRSDRAVDRVVALDDGRLVIAADVRLDNRGELFDRLNIAHPDRAAISDSELILRGYRHWGERVAAALVGDFAFVIYDNERGVLYGARDPFGFRPFFYWRHRSGLLFASALVGLFALPDVPMEIDDLALASYLVGRQVDGDRSFYRDIAVLKGGHQFVADRQGTFRISRFWALHPEREIKLSSESEYFERVLEITTSAVEARLVDGSRNALLLSGGMDSSTIACLAARHLAPSVLHGITSIVPDRYAAYGQDERAFVRVLDDALPNLSVESISGEPGGPLSGVELSLNRHRTPYVLDGQHFLTSAMFDAAAAGGNKVLMSGVGGDLALSYQGYGILAELVRRGQFRRLLRHLRTARRNGRSVNGLIRSEILARLMPLWLWRQLAIWRKGDAWRESSAIAHDLERRTSIIRHLRAEDSDPTTARRYPSLRGQQAAWLAGYSDGGPGYLWALDGAARGLEVSYPLLDTRLVEFCLAAPNELKNKDGGGRRLLSASMKGILPEAIRVRQDKGRFCPHSIAKLQEAVPSLCAEFAGPLADRQTQGYLNIDRLQAWCRDADSERPLTQHEFLLLTSSYYGARFVTALEKWTAERGRLAVTGR